MARARGSTGSRGAKDWALSFFNGVTLSGTQAIISTLTDASPVTVLRSRGHILVKGTPDATSDSGVVGLGIIVVGDAAAVVGGASVPGPLTDGSGPWIWHAIVPLAAGQAALAGDDIGSFARVDVDSKAMRKLGIAEQLVLVGQVGSGNSYASVSVIGGIRVLALHG